MYTIYVDRKIDTGWTTCRKTSQYNTNKYDSPATKTIFELHNAPFLIKYCLAGVEVTNFGHFDVIVCGGVLYWLALGAVPQLTRWCLQSW